MKLTDADYSRAALLLGCEPAAVRAVAAVESAGEGFFQDGCGQRPVILFEAHIFSRLTGHKYDASHPDISSPTWNKALYLGGKREHDRLARAVALDREAALKSASWGKFQIMGFNYDKCGFDLSGLQAFINAMYKSEGEHLTAFCHFIISMGLADELQRKDWSSFARVYNGPKFAENRYDELLAKSFHNFSAIDKLAGVPA